MILQQAEQVSNVTAELLKLENFNDYKKFFTDNFNGQTTDISIYHHFYIFKKDNEIRMKVKEWVTNQWIDRHPIKPLFPKSVKDPMIVGANQIPKLEAGLITEKSKLEMLKCGEYIYDAEKKKKYLELVEEYGKSVIPNPKQNKPTRIIIVEDKAILSNENVMPNLPFGIPSIMEKKSL